MGHHRATRGQHVSVHVHTYIHTYIRVRNVSRARSRVTRVCMYECTAVVVLSVPRHAVKFMRLTGVEVVFGVSRHVNRYLSLDHSDRGIVRATPRSSLNDNDGPIYVTLTRVSRFAMQRRRRSS